MTDRFDRRTLLASVAAGAVPALAGCQFPSGLGNLELTVMNRAAEPTLVAIAVRDPDTGDILFEDESEHEPNDPDVDGIPTHAFGVVTTTELGGSIRLEASSPDVPLDIEELITVNCAPEHPTYVEIRDGTDGRELEMTTSSCPPTGRLI